MNKKRKPIIIPAPSVNNGKTFQFFQQSRMKEAIAGADQIPPDSIFGFGREAENIRHNKLKKLREKYFAECVENGKIIYTPHDLFEWFKKNL